jgi:hypothetical protein
MSWLILGSGLYTIVSLAGTLFWVRRTAHRLDQLEKAEVAREEAASVSRTTICRPPELRITSIVRR